VGSQTRSRSAEWQNNDVPNGHMSQIRLPQLVGRIAFCLGTGSWVCLALGAGCTWGPFGLPCGGSAPTHTTLGSEGCRSNVFNMMTLRRPKPADRRNHALEAESRLKQQSASKLSVKTMPTQHGEHHVKALLGNDGCLEVTLKLRANSGTPCQKYWESHASTNQARILWALSLRH
jgi:hypothetical protein